MTKRQELNQAKYIVKKSIYVGDTGDENWRRWCVVSDTGFVGWFDSQSQAQVVADTLNGVAYQGNIISVRNGVAKR